MGNLISIQQQPIREVRKGLFGSIRLSARATITFSAPPSVDDMAPIKAELPQGVRQQWELTRIELVSVASVTVTVYFWGVFAEKRCAEFVDRLKKRIALTAP